MVKLNESTMQSDHSYWLNDFAAWSRDIECWKARHDVALSQVVRQYASIVALQSVVDEHAAMIDAYTDLCDRHASAMTSDSQPDQRGDMTLVHSQMGARHDRLKETHERIRRHHSSAAFRFIQMESANGHDVEAET